MSIINSEKLYAWNGAGLGAQEPNPSGKIQLRKKSPKIKTKTNVSSSNVDFHCPLSNHRTTGLCVNGAAADLLACER
jgi:hypothetical protein